MLSLKRKAWEIREIIDMWV